MSEMWFVMDSGRHGYPGVVGPFPRKELAEDWFRKMYPERDYREDPQFFIVIAEDPEKVLQLRTQPPSPPGNFR